MFVAIDVWSRYAWIIPIANKTGASVLSAFRQLINDSGRKPKRVWWDQGKEFLNANMTAFLKRQGIESYSTFGQHGSMFVERLNRTIKTRLEKVFTASHSNRWIDVLPGLMETYNSSKHSSIKMSPEQASKPENQQRLHDLQYKDADKHLEEPSQPSKIKLNTWMRISRQKGVFEKGYERLWSEEIFRVISILHTSPRVFEVEDLLGERVLGAFYTEELQQTQQDPNGKFLIQSIIDSKIQNVRGQVPISMKKVQWFGYEAKFDSWVDEKSITLFPGRKGSKKPIGEAVMFPGGWKHSRVLRFPRET